MTAPIIITADMGKADQAWANGLRRAHFPAERNFVDAHITLFHHLPPSHLPEIKSRLAALVADRLLDAELGILDHYAKKNGLNRSQQAMRKILRDLPVD